MKKIRVKADRATSEQTQSIDPEKLETPSIEWLQPTAFEPAVQCLKDYARRAIHEVPLDVLPSAEVLHKLVVEAFWATLIPDEARFPEFALAYCPPEPETLRLKPRPFTARAVAKLAPSVSHGSHLGVAIIDGQLQIWGILSGIVRCAVVRGTSPGNLAIQIRHDNLFLLTRNELKNLVQTEDALHGVGRANLSSILGEAFASTMKSPHQRIISGVLLTGLVQFIRHQRHGGTILIVPNTCDKAMEWLDLGANRTWYPLLRNITKIFLEKIDKSADPWDGIPKVKDLHNFLLREPVSEGFRRTLESVGALAGVDGAIVLTQSMRLRSFGAMIRPPKATEATTYVEEIRVRTAIPPTDPKEIEEQKKLKPIATLGGARRQSAARFVANNYDTVALTVSQDGPVSFTAWYADINAAVNTVGIEVFLE
jgi:hypothetical protein